MTNRRTKTNRKPAGYSIKESQLAEIMLLECSLRNNVQEIFLLKTRLNCIGDRLQKLRNEIKSQ